MMGTMIGWICDGPESVHYTQSRTQTKSETRKIRELSKTKLFKSFFPLLYNKVKSIKV